MTPTPYGTGRHDGVAHFLLLSRGRAWDKMGTFDACGTLCAASRFEPVRWATEKSWRTWRRRPWIKSLPLRQTGLKSQWGALAPPSSRLTCR